MRKTPGSLRLHNCHVCILERGARNRLSKYWAFQKLRNLQSYDLVFQFLIAYSMQKQRGRPGPIYDMNDANVYLGRQRREGSLTKRTHFTHALLNNKVVSCFVNVFGTPALGQHYKKRLQDCFLSPPPLYT